MITVTVAQIVSLRTLEGDRSVDVQLSEQKRWQRRIYSRGPCSSLQDAAADVGGGPDFDSPQTAAVTGLALPRLNFLDETERDRDRRLKQHREEDEQACRS